MFKKRRQKKCYDELVGVLVQACNDQAHVYKEGIKPLLLDGGLSEDAGEFYESDVFQNGIQKVRDQYLFAVQEQVLNWYYAADEGNPAAEGLMPAPHTQHGKVLRAATELESEMAYGEGFLTEPMASGRIFTLLFHAETGEGLAIAGDAIQLNHFQNDVMTEAGQQVASELDASYNSTQTNVINMPPQGEHAEDIASAMLDKLQEFQKYASINALEWNKDKEVYLVGFLIYYVAGTFSADIVTNILWWHANGQSDNKTEINEVAESIQHSYSVAQGISEMMMNNDGTLGEISAEHASFLQRTNSWGADDSTREWIQNELISFYRALRAFNEQ